MYTQASCSDYVLLRNQINDLQQPLLGLSVFLVRHSTPVFYLHVIGTFTGPVIVFHIILGVFTTYVGVVVSGTEATTIFGTATFVVELITVVCTTATLALCCCFLPFNAFLTAFAMMISFRHI